MDAELLHHPYVRDAGLEGRNDLCVRGVGDFVAHLAEALDVFAEGLARLLAHAAELSAFLHQTINSTQINLIQKV